MRQGLGVVDDGRRAVHALLGREGRLAARERESRPHAGDHRRLLAADVEAASSARRDSDTGPPIAAPDRGEQRVLLPRRDGGAQRGDSARSCGLT